MRLDYESTRREERERKMRVADSPRFSRTKCRKVLERHCCGFNSSRQRMVSGRAFSNFAKFSSSHLPSKIVPRHFP